MINRKLNERGRAHTSSKAYYFLSAVSAVLSLHSGTLRCVRPTPSQVPDSVSDAAAVFAEPLAAACRIVEQGLAPPGVKAAVLGDGKLGLLCAEVLARRATSLTRPACVRAVEGDGGCGDSQHSGLVVEEVRGSTTLIGRHKEKMDLCCGGKQEVGGGGAGCAGCGRLDSSVLPLVGRVMGAAVVFGTRV